MVFVASLFLNKLSLLMKNSQMQTTIYIQIIHFDLQNFKYIFDALLII